MTDNTSLKTATLAGGCFWCLEAVYREVEGVVKVVPGYTGGITAYPTYEQVCSGRTGHAEAVQITFAPDIISYRDILEIFFSIHDPTTLNRQGADRGTQYRSAIFYHDEQQKQTAEEMIRELDKEHRWESPLVTQTSRFDIFYPAEAYHKDYYARNPEQTYCQVIISPKLSKLRKQWSGKLKSQI